MLLLCGERLTLASLCKHFSLNSTFRLDQATSMFSCLSETSCDFRVRTLNPQQIHVLGLDNPPYKWACFLYEYKCLLSANENIQVIYSFSFI